jgi:hypothetical protein
MRLYAPRSEALTGKWNPPPVMRLVGLDTGCRKRRALVHLLPRRNAALFGLQGIVGINVINLISPHIYECF